MGKSHFLENELQPYIQDQGFGFSSISSDRIRRELINMFLSENPSKSEDDAMQATGVETAKEFGRRLDNLFDKAIKSDSKKEVIYLDKNHPPRALGVTE